MKATDRHSRQSWAAFLVCLVALVGVVAPFAGSNDVGRVVLPKRATLASLHRPLSTALHGDALAATGEPKSRIRSILSKFSLSSGRSSGRWKGGESKASIPSRLLFRYVSPLLDVASRRNIDENDAFPVTDDQSMDSAVDCLANHYARARNSSQKRIEL